MALFNLGDYILSSGKSSNFKIDCEALSSDDLLGLANLMAKKIGGFRQAIGIPRGGLRLATALNAHRSNKLYNPLLLVDDVLTTSRSLDLGKSLIMAMDPKLKDSDIIGTVIF
ncbi:hypothetical protein LCGC14_2753680, partial [marine sediment metagenome]